MNVGTLGWNTKVDYSMPSFSNRVIVPVFFAIMCYYLLPLMVSGPNSKVLFEKYYVEVQTRRLFWTKAVNPKKAEFTTF